MPVRRQPPTVRRRRLAAELLGLRTAAGLTREQVADETGLSTGALFRIEKAHTRPQRRTLTALLNHYGVTDKERRDELADLLRQADEVGWLQLFEDNLAQSYATLISFEAEASREHLFELAFVPGLFQTEAYARTVIRALLPEAEDEEVERQTEVRMRRQQGLAKPHATSHWAMLDESVIRRTVGSADIMREQLRHLLTLARRPNITLQVVPFSTGAHVGMPGSFLVLEFPDPDPPLVYTENAGGGLFLEQVEDVDRYRSSFQRLTAQALSPDDTLDIIRQAAEAA